MEEKLIEYLEKEMTRLGNKLDDLREIGEHELTVPLKNAWEISYIYGERNAIKNIVSLINSLKINKVANE